MVFPSLMDARLKADALAWKLHIVGVLISMEQVVSRLPSYPLNSNLPPSHIASTDSTTAVCYLICGSDLAFRNGPPHDQLKAGASLEAIYRLHAYIDGAGPHSSAGSSAEILPASFQVLSYVAEASASIADIKSSRDTAGCADSHLYILTTPSSSEAVNTVPVAFHCTSVSVSVSLYIDPSLV